MKKRYNFLDVIRLLSMAGIVYYHLIVTLYLKGIRQLESVSILYENSNMHIAKVCVGLFFMISGAGLMLSTKDKEHFSYAEYYKKRFFRILVPFYLVYVLYLVTFILLTGETLNSIYKDHNAHPLSIIFTLLGMDSYLSSYGVGTFALGIGEWFLGALVLMYIIFPLLRWALLKNKWITLGVACVYYIVILVTYPMMSYASTNPGFVNFTVKVFDFFLGMFLILFVDKFKKWVCFGVGLPVFVFFLVCPIKLPIDDSLMILMQITSLFLVFRGLEDVFNKTPKCMKVVTFLCKYTYEFFLVHHFIIDYMTLQVVGRPYGNLDILRLFVFEILVVTLATILVKLILKYGGIAINKLFTKKQGAAK